MKRQEMDRATQTVTSWERGEFCQSFIPSFADDLSVFCQAKGWKCDMRRAVDDSDQMEYPRAPDRRAPSMMGDSEKTAIAISRTILHIGFWIPLASSMLQAFLWRWKLHLHQRGEIEYLKRIELRNFFPVFTVGVAVRSTNALGTFARGVTYKLQPRVFLWW